jgi:hypothetical protein
MIFSDFGIVATTAKNAPLLTRTLLSALAARRPAAIVLELGDGLLGDYGVDAILADEQIRNAMTVVVLCATDPVAAWGGARILLDQYGIKPKVVTGQATDNAVGIQQIAHHLQLPAINALTHGALLGDAVAESAGLARSEQAAP